MKARIEALELYFEPPVATRAPKVRTVEVEVWGGLARYLSATIKRRLEVHGFVEATSERKPVKFVRRIGDVVDTAIVPKKSEISSRHA